MQNHTRLILLTGATGYIGGRLLGRLQLQGARVRCMARRPEHLCGRVVAQTEVVSGDVFDADSLRAALQGVDTAFYLVHSMSDARGFVAGDRQAAHNFAAAALGCGVRRIIYLGGLGEPGNLSQHLESRQEVGRILRASGVQTLELRASIIIGSGSLSFEMIRSLVEKLPVMTTPRWVHSLAQPIGVEDVLEYLLESIDVGVEGSRVFEIGGAQRASYGEIMREYARQRGLKRWIVPVRVLTPRLSSLWLGLVTPVYARVGRALIEGVRNDTVVRDESAHSVFRVRPRGLGETIARALRNEDRDFAETRWTNAMSSSGKSLPSYGGVRFGSRIVDSRTAYVPLDPTRAIQRIGGRTGWYYANPLWRLRGFFDLLLGGVGMRRGRTHPTRIVVGDALDFWRVEAFEPDRLLRLRAEMKVPGRAWLQFEVQPGAAGSQIRQTALFDPRGLFGILYWYCLYPIHSLIFSGMLRGIVRAATHPKDDTTRRRQPAETTAATRGSERASEDLPVTNPVSMKR
jgi:uncharacterized protein YbjT (DUF2867 family)